MNNKEQIVSVVMLVVFGMGLYLGGMIEHRTHTAPAYKELRAARFMVERFENQEVFDHARYVASVTGTPLYQVLTGKKAKQDARKEALMKAFVTMSRPDARQVLRDMEGRGR